MTKPLSETTVTLMKAREILEKGWCQGDYHDGDSHCIAGAIYAALDTPVHTDELELACQGYCDAARAVIAVLPPAHPDGCEEYDGIQIPRFNDAPDRTHAEVLDVMDQAIQRSMEEG